MTEHTKGPWVVDSINCGYPHDICLGYDVPGECRPVLLATVFADDDDFRPITISDLQANANARLIAAAPELLAALECAINTVECASIDIRTGEELPWYRMAKAAIAKTRSPATNLTQSALQ